jgi:hypothetical protein
MVRWVKLSDYAITNGKELEGNGYKHGTHFISKSFVDGVAKYTLWEGDKMISIFKSAEEAKGAVK